MVLQLHGQKSRARKRRIVLSCEGEVTEPEYFNNLNSMSSTVVFEIVENDGTGSDPDHVLSRMKRHLKSNSLEEGDEAWLVMDQDKWTKKNMKKSHDWENEKTCHHLAISRRRFEDWLKLHVEDDRGAQKKYHELLAGDNKHVPADFVTKDRVMTAVRLAKGRANVGNVYEIIESFFRK